MLFEVLFLQQVGAQTSRRSVRFSTESQQLTFPVFHVGATRGSWKRRIFTVMTRMHQELLPKSQHEVQLQGDAAELRRTTNYWETVETSRCSETSQTVVSTVDGVAAPPLLKPELRNGPKIRHISLVEGLPRGGSGPIGHHYCVWANTAVWRHTGRRQTRRLHLTLSDSTQTGGATGLWVTRS